MAGITAIAAILARHRLVARFDRFCLTKAVEGGFHGRAIRAVRDGNWFNEELYARFRLIGSSGTDTQRSAWPSRPWGSPSQADTSHSPMQTLRSG